MDDPFGSSGSEAPPPYLGGTQPPGISERMQALMSRAEQEVAEQRQLQALVSDVRQSLQQIHDEVRQAAGAHTLEAVRGEVTGLGGEIRSSTTMLGERLEAVVRAVGAGAQVMQGVGQQLDRVTELLNHQQQQIAALSAAVGAQQESLRTVPAVRDDVAAVRGDVTGVRGEVSALRERVDGVAGDVRSDTASALNALAERIDAAVLALAEALLRRPARGSDEDAPTTATMTMPVTTPPWAGAAEGTVGDTGGETAGWAGDETAGDPAGEPDAAAVDDAGVAEPAGDASDDAEEDAVGAVEAATEAATEAAGDDVPGDDVAEEDVPEGDVPRDDVAEQAPVEDAALPADAPVSGGSDTADTADTAAGADDEVPLSAWVSDVPPADAPTGDAAAEPAEEPPAWGWDGAREDEDKSDKRRPWWRPGG